MPALFLLSRLAVPGETPQLSLTLVQPQSVDAPLQVMPSKVVSYSSSSHLIKK